MFLPELISLVFFGDGWHGEQFRTADAEPEDSERYAEPDGAEGFRGGGERRLEDGRGHKRTQEDCRG